MPTLFRHCGHHFRWTEAAVGGADQPEPSFLAYIQVP